MKGYLKALRLYRHDVSIANAFWGSFDSPCMRQMPRINSMRWPGECLLPRPISHHCSFLRDRCGKKTLEIANFIIPNKGKKAVLCCVVNGLWRWDGIWKNAMLQEMPHMSSRLRHDV